MATLDRIPTENPPPTSTAWMNPARAIAIIAVVAIHSLGTVVEQNFAGMGPDWWLANAVDSASRWSVPVFIMISGALALDPNRGSKPRRFQIGRASCRERLETTDVNAWSRSGL